MPKSVRSLRIAGFTTVCSSQQRPQILVIHPPLPYRGAACGDPWPLGRLLPEERDDEERALCALLHERVETWHFENGTYPPAVIDDLALAARYLQACEKRDIKTRLLLCATPRRKPRLIRADRDRFKAQANFLGYDYLYSDMTYSALNDDLTNPPPDERLIAASLTRNANGLFDTEADLSRYVAARWEYLEEQGETFRGEGTRRVRETPLEDTGDFVVQRVYELDPARFLDEKHSE